MQHISDIIAAIATPAGVGGISVIRVSGRGAIELTGQLFRGGRQPLAMAPSHTAHFGQVTDGEGGEPIDDVVATLFRGPHSYTGDDTVEVSCHGGMLITEEILGAIIRAGARIAGPGEFTKRAFLNGRLDLSQAEAVAAMIEARSRTARRASYEMLHGALHDWVETLRSDILRIIAQLEAELEFSEENIELIAGDALAREIDAIIAVIGDQIERSGLQKVIREGITVTIVGRPNVGKSSIFNNLLKEKRAIVTDIPGTTRDFIEEEIRFDSLLLTIVDTAGIRSTDEKVEREGILRSRRTIRNAQVILFVLDASSHFTADDGEIFSLIESERSKESQVICVINKSDLIRSPYPMPREIAHLPHMEISSLTESDVPKLAHAINRSIAALQTAFDGENRVTTNERHVGCLRRSVGFLESASRDARGGISREFVIVNLRSGADALGDIIGTVTSDDVLNAIFSRFCIGK